MRAEITVRDGANAEIILENHHFRLEFSTAGSTSLYDKRLEHNVFCNPTAIPIIIDDPSDTWSHGVFRFDRKRNLPVQTSLHLESSGPVKATVCVRSQIGNSLVKQYVRLYPDLDRIDVEVSFDWHEKHSLLKILLPVNLENSVVTYGIPYGHIIRPANGEEEPMQNWIDVSGNTPGSNRKAGLSILNDGKYSASVLTGPSGTCEVNLTVLRSPVYAHHDPAVLDADGDYHFMDPGWQNFRYSLRS